MLRLRRPAWWAVLLTLAGVVLFVRLGVWQLDRAHEKEQLLARFADATSQPAVPFASVVNGVKPEHYPHVSLRGRLQPGHSYVLDNQSRHERPGVVVFVPMKVCTDEACRSYRNRTLLVGMGFLRRDPGSREMPHIPPIKHARAVVSGLYAPPPGKGFEMGGNALARQDTWPKLTTYLDMNQVAHDLGVPLYPRVLLLDPDPASAYARSWTPATMPPARHRAYAFQWFSFALAALVIFLVLHRQRPENGNDDERGQLRP